MNTNSRHILESALALPDSERAELAGSLFLSLDAGHEEGCNQAWADEVAARVRSIDDGTVELVPWTKVMDEMRRRRDG